MDLERMGAMFETLVTALLAAGILWVFAWSISGALAQSQLAAYGKSAPFLQIIIYIGGVILIGRITDIDAASGTALILAVLWCSAVIRETYLRATHYTLDAPDVTAALVDLPSAAVQATPHVAHQSTPKKDSLSGRHGTGLLDTMTALISTHTLPMGPFSEPTTPEQTDAKAETSRRPSFYPSPSDRADVAQLPSLPLSKRPVLGKRTIESLQFRERQ